MNPPVVHYVPKGNDTSLCFVTRPKHHSPEWRHVNCKRCRANAGGEA
jgi:hypothetical protein